MKTFIQVLAAGLLCGLGGVAQAAIVTYTFEAKVSSITERQNPGANYVDVTQSGIAGTPVALGDILTGSFQYDTSVKLDSYQPTQPPGSDYRWYEAGKTDYITYVDRNTGLAFTSLASQNWLGAAVQDSHPGSGYTSDFFTMTHVAIDDTMTALGGIWLHDLFGNAFQSAALPVELDLASFQFASLDASFGRQSDDAFMMFSADITLLERVEVPEPGSAFLFAIAGGGLFGLRRMRRS